SSACTRRSNSSGLGRRSVRPVTVVSLIFGWADGVPTVVRRVFRSQLPVLADAPQAYRCPAKAPGWDGNDALRLTPHKRLPAPHCAILGSIKRGKGNAIRVSVCFDESPLCPRSRSPSILL